MKLPRYSASAKIAKQRVVDRGVDSEPPCRLCLSELATTLDLDNTSDDAPLAPDFQAIVQCVNTCAMTNTQNSTPPTRNQRGPPDQRGVGMQRKTNQYQPLSSIPNDPSLKFTPARKIEQCKACKCWDHCSNSCFLMCQVYWCQEFIKKYPWFVEAIAFQYEAYHLRSQRAAQVRCLFQVNSVDSQYNESYLFDVLERHDEDFVTNIAEPGMPEE